MAEAARRLKANKKLEGQPCGWCHTSLALGEDAVLCSACSEAHHAACWDAENGCSAAACENAPLAQLESQEVEEQAVEDDLPPGYERCPSCANPISAKAQICDFCDHVMSPDGVYHGPKINAPGATSSLVWGIVGFFICGIILGAVAISESQKAKAAIRANPRYGGEGMATAGLVLGIIGIVGHILIIILNFGLR